MATKHWRDWDRRLIGWFLAALVLLVIVVGDPRGDAPEETPEAAPTASPRQLCGSLDQMAFVRDELVDDVPGTTIHDLRRAATRTRDLGTRTDELDPQARAGLDFFTGLFLDLPDQPTTQQLMSAGTPASVTDQAHADAFVTWLGDNCPQPGR